KEAMAQAFQKFLPSEPEDQNSMMSAIFPTIHHALLVMRDGEGKTMADRWEAEGWTGLNNDEKLMMQHRRNSFVTVLEVQRLLDPDTFEVLDLLEPGSSPFVVTDRLSNFSSARFSKLFTWITRYPHFNRTGGIGFTIPNHVWSRWREEMQRSHADARQVR